VRVVVEGMTRVEQSGGKDRKKEKKTRKEGKGPHIELPNVRMTQANTKLQCYYLSCSSFIYL